jgi:hypothetical protein
MTRRRAESLDPIEPSLAERQAALNRLFAELRATPLPDMNEPPPAKVRRRSSRRRPPKIGASVRIRLPDDGTREALMAASLEAGVTIHEWVIAAIKAGLASTDKQVLAGICESQRLARAEAELQKRQRSKQAKHENRLATVERLRDKGLTDAAIAAKMGISSAALCHFLRQVGKQRTRSK